MPLSTTWSPARRKLEPGDVTRAGNHTYPSISYRTYKSHSLMFLIVIVTLPAAKAKGGKNKNAVINKSRRKKVEILSFIEFVGIISLVYISCF
jgi:hypothetical protein